jgi:polyisoprenoid-binding protein YceI
MKLSSDFFSSLEEKSEARNAVMEVGTKRGLATVQYIFDRSASRFTVQAFATGLLSSFGHNPTIAIRDYEGEVQFVSDTYENASVRLKLKTSTLEVLDEMKRDDREKLERLMYDEVLDTAHFPEVVFESKQVSVQKVSSGLLQVRVTGNLTLHGVSQSHSFDAQVRDMDFLLRISGNFSLRQSDYGMKPVSFAAGALRLKDELKFSLEIVAKRQE